ncbi:hypothetical protein [Bradyrhizobium sp. I1.14.4]|uniref:hypothetical protein n=1 Tax=unclassified Bradyrhizobium TaxID=2631580 RepID=UPI003D2573D3
MRLMGSSMRGRREIDGIGRLTLEAGKGLREADEAGSERGTPRHLRRRDGKLAKARLSFPKGHRGRSEALLQPRKIIASPADCEQPGRQRIVEREISAPSNSAAAACAQAGGNPGGKILASGMRQQRPQPADRKAHRFRPRVRELAKRAKNGGEFANTRKPRQHFGHFGQQRMGNAASGIAADIPGGASDHDQIVDRSLRRPLHR